MKRLSITRLKSGKCTQLLLASFLSLVSMHVSANSRYVDVPDYTAYAYTPNGFTPLYATPVGGSAYQQLRGKQRVRVIAHQSLWARVYFNGRVQGWVPKNRLQKHEENHPDYVNVADYTAYAYTPGGFTPLYATPVGGRAYQELRGKQRVRVIAHQSIWARVYFNGRVQGWVPKSRLVK